MYREIPPFTPFVLTVTDVISVFFIIMLYDKLKFPSILRPSKVSGNVPRE